MGVTGNAMSNSFQLDSLKMQDQLNNSTITPETKTLKLTDKLMKMKERVKRDRSANNQKSQNFVDNRDNSLFGRQKPSLIFEAETQKVKAESRRLSSLAQGPSLSKQHFKEDLDFKKSSPMTRSTNDFNVRAKSIGNEKENLNINMNKDSQSAAGNRYKRTQQRSLQQLADYQQRYERLQQNFKKFSNNIINSNQTEQLIENLKIKNGLQIIAKVASKNMFFDVRASFKQWTLAIGLTMKKMQLDRKAIVVAKLAEKIHKKQMNFSKFSAYQVWKKMTFGQDLHGSQNFYNFFAVISANTQYFQSCVADDSFLAKEINALIQSLSRNDIFSSELIVLQDQQITVFTGTDEILQHQIEFSSPCILEKALIEYGEDSDKKLYITQCLKNDRSFNHDVDMPIDQSSFKQINQIQENPFNQIKSLALFIIITPSYIEYLQNGTQIEKQLIFRFYTEGKEPNSQKTHISETNSFMRSFEHLQNLLIGFIQNITNQRQEKSLQLTKEFQLQKQILQFELENEINKYVHLGNQNLLSLLFKESDQNQFGLMIKEFSENVFSLIPSIGLNDLILRQIIYQERAVRGAKEVFLISEGSQKNELFRQHDHVQEAKEIIEDFLDYKKEYFVHQLSYCPKIIPQCQDFAPFTFIFHRKQLYEKQNQSKTNAIEPSAKASILMLLRGIAPIAATIIKQMVGPIQQVSKLKSIVDLQVKLHQIVELFAGKLEERELEDSIDLSDKLEITLDAQNCLTSLLVAVCEGQTEQPWILINMGQMNMHGQQGPYFSLQPIENAQKVQKDIQYGQSWYSMSKSQLQLGQDGCQVTEDGMSGHSVVTFFFDRIPSNYSSETLSNQGASITFAVIQSRSNSGNYSALFLYQGVELSENKIQLLQQSTKQYLTRLERVISTFKNNEQSKNQFIEDIQVFKTNLESKEALVQHFFQPFLNDQSLKTLGNTINQFFYQIFPAERTNYLNSEYFEQEFIITQIAYVAPGIFIDDIRNLQTYGPQINKQTTDKREELILQCYSQDQQIIYEDDLLAKFVALLPIFSYQNNSDVTIDNLTQSKNFNLRKQATHIKKSIIIKFIFDKNQIQTNEVLNQKLSIIQERFMDLLIEPIASIIDRNSCFQKQIRATDNLQRVLNSKKLREARHLFSFMRDLKAKNVYHFSRCSLYQKIAKSRGFLNYRKVNKDLMGQGLTNNVNGIYFDQQERWFEEQQEIYQQILKAIQIFNKQALKFKALQFRKYQVSVRQSNIYIMPKKQRKATAWLSELYNKFILRAQFMKFVVKTQSSRYLKNPKTKKLAKALTVIFNYNLIKKRLAFIKMKKVLNSNLRAGMTSTIEQDNQLFIQLGQILLMSQGQPGGLHGGLTYALGEVFKYLKKSSSEEFIQDNQANIDLSNGAFTGHVDEVVISVHPNVFASTKLEGLHKNLSSTTQIYHAHFPQPFKKKFLHSNTDKQNSRAIRLNDSTFLDRSDLSPTPKDHIIDGVRSELAHQQTPKNFYGLSDDSKNKWSNQEYISYQLQTKKDIILTMLLKSNGLIFNFQNVQQSLSDIFLSKQSKSKDSAMGSRYQTVKNSKSALLIPMFDISQTRVVGSLEFYRYHQQAFTEEMEKRYNYFAQRLTDMFTLHARLKKQSLEIASLKQQMQIAIKPAVTLTSILKSASLNGPEVAFPGAVHVNPILILNQLVKVSLNLDDDSYRSKRIEDLPTYTWAQLKQAFFFDFKSNLIFSFDYDSTFIEEVLDNKCILEMFQNPNTCAAGDAPFRFVDKPGITSSQQKRGNSSIRRRGIGSGLSDHNKSLGLFDFDESQSESMESRRELNDSFTKKGAIQSARRMQTNKVCSVSNDVFRTILYYPVLSVNDETKVDAIIEVGYKKRNFPGSPFTNEDEKIQLPQGYDPLVTDEIQDFLDQFRSQINQVRVRMANFCDKLSLIEQRRADRQICKFFISWKAISFFQRLNLYS